MILRSSHHIFIHRPKQLLRQLHMTKAQLGRNFTPTRQCAQHRQRHLAHQRVPGNVPSVWDEPWEHLVLVYVIARYHTACGNCLAGLGGSEGLLGRIIEDIITTLHAGQRYFLAMAELAKATFYPCLDVVFRGHAEPISCHKSSFWIALLCNKLALQTVFSFVVCQHCSI